MSFQKAFAKEMMTYGRETLVNELTWVRGGSVLFDPPEQIAKAREWAQAKVDAMNDDAVYELLEATAAKPCPTCGS